MMPRDCGHTPRGLYFFPRKLAKAGRRAAQTLFQPSVRAMIVDCHAELTRVFHLKTQSGSVCETGDLVQAFADVICGSDMAPGDLVGAGVEVLGAQGGDAHNRWQLVLAARRERSR